MWLVTTVLAQIQNIFTITGSPRGYNSSGYLWRQACSFLGRVLWPCVVSFLRVLHLLESQRPPGDLVSLNCFWQVPIPKSSVMCFLLWCHRSRSSWATQGFGVGFLGILSYSGTAVLHVCSEWTQLTQVRKDKSVRIEKSGKVKYSVGNIVNNTIITLWCQVSTRLVRRITL